MRKGGRLFRRIRAVVLFAGFLATAPARSEPCSFLDPPDPNADPPDDTYHDANGDGVDGMSCGPVFVSPSGSDASLGTTEAPMRTIGAAVLAARSFTPPRDVYIAEGVYEETVVLAPGVDLHGGYFVTGSGWSRSSATRATIRLGPVGGDVALLGVGVDQPTSIDHLIVEADRDPSRAVGGNTNAAALLRESTARVRITQSTLSAAAGTRAIDGAGGEAGSPGAEGLGYPGSPFSGARYGYPGGTGSDPGLNDGGAGGNGGGINSCCPMGNTAGCGVCAGSGQAGRPGKGRVGGLGGVGGAEISTGGPGGPGGPGLPGANGASGSFARPGAEGARGEPGSGGGGGGGGGATFNYASAATGGGGGGGGAGGSGGGGGQGGMHGGSSYGVVARNASFDLFQSALVAGNGGDGGAGGRGGLGGNGGLGGLGSPGTLWTPNGGNSSSNAGGPGGEGGLGGPGGHGGGGSGGNSIGILHLMGGDSALDEASSIAVGSAGRGGLGPGNSGVDGIAAPSHDERGRVAIPIQPTCMPSCPPFRTHARLFTDGASAASAIAPIASENGIEPAFSVSIVAPPSAGSATASSNELRYVPGSEFTGVDVFEYRACRVPEKCSDGFAVVSLPEPGLGFALVSAFGLLALLKRRS